MRKIKPSLMLLMLCLCTPLDMMAGPNNMTDTPPARIRHVDSHPIQPLSPGDYTFQTTHASQQRAYMVHIPTSYRPTLAMPMVISLHGGGGHMRYQADDDYYGMISASERAGFIAVFPNGYSRFGGKLATWNAGICCGRARDIQNDDVGFIRQVVQEMQQRANVDSQRIFANGMSNGGMMAYRLACEMADTFKAIAAVAGTDGTLNCKPSKPVSVLHLHAIDDERVLFNGGSGSRSNTHANFTSVPNTIAKWVALNGCTSPPQRVLQINGAYCELYSQCKQNTQVQLCVSETGGHAWPGGKKVRTGKSNSSPLQATDLIWQFYQSLSRDL